MVVIPDRDRARREQVSGRSAERTRKLLVLRKLRQSSKPGTHAEAVQAVPHVLLLQCGMPETTLAHAQALLLASPQLFRQDDGTRHTLCQRQVPLSCKAPTYPLCMHTLHYMHTYAQQAMLGCGHIAVCSLFFVLDTICKIVISHRIRRFS